MLYPRYISVKLERALKNFPVVLINGPRQSGKSTLVKEFIKKGLLSSYISLDDINTVSAIQEDSLGFLSNLPIGTVIDEIQLRPDLFPLIKQIVDANRVNGRFVLTGSANILLLPKLSESLAGRMHVLRLYPLSQTEIQSTKPMFVNWLLEPNVKFATYKTKETNYEKIVSQGGFPEVLNMEKLSQNDWFQSYNSTLLLRDVRDLAQIEQINVLPNLLQILTQRIGSTLNQSDISRMTGLTNVTQKRYLNLLEALYLTETIKPWFANLDKRLVKSPKIYLGDTGIASFVLNQNIERLKTNRILFGQLLENWVIVELQKIISFSDKRLNIFHFRTSDQYEIDIILEDPNGDLYAIEVKSSTTIKPEFWSGIDVLIDQTKNRVKKAIIFYTGTQIIQVSSAKFILPISLLWDDEVL